MSVECFEQRKLVEIIGSQDFSYHSGYTQSVSEFCSAQPIMARRRSPLKLPASAFVLAALFVVALQLQGPLAVAARSVPFSEGDGSEDLESLLRIRGGSKAQAQREGSQGYTDVCGGLEGEESVHEPCFAPNGEVQFCW